VNDTPFSTSHVVNVKGLDVGVACLNTAWRTTGEPDDIDYGNLLIGERAIRSCLEDIKNCAVKIAVFHHPLKEHLAANQTSNNQTDRFVTNHSAFTATGIAGWRDAMWPMILSVTGTTA